MKFFAPLKFTRCCILKICGSETNSVLEQLIICPLEIIIIIIFAEDSTVDRQMADERSKFWWSQWCSFYE